MWEIINLQSLAPEFVGRILQILFWIVPFCFGASLIWLLRLNKENFKDFAICLFLLIALLTATQKYEERFFDCNKVVDSAEEKVYECYMRETIKSQWKGPVRFTDAYDMIADKYKRELYKGE